MYDLAVTARLALHTGARAGQGTAAGFRNFIAAFDAMVCPLTGGQASARGEHAVSDGVFNLVQNRAVARPTASHDLYDVPRYLRH